MHLESIKLAGFKSFSQPIFFKFPSNRIGLVGPNGCGKSNIIDAIRWVLGESSASGLRGDSLGDIIFNGSAEHSRAGRASVEMTFAGNLGQLDAKYAKQPKVKIRRVLERDRDSRYYIDNQTCRRKDIAALFAGMGLTGKADYSIVTQGSVINIAESKPEYVRSLIEEAADITDYLQKRKETLTRIKTTRFNLRQIKISKEQSTSRMRELNKQAEDAKQVTTLRQELKKTREQLVLTQYADLMQRRLGKEAKEEKDLQKLNACKEQQAHLLGLRERLYLDLGTADDTFKKLNASFNEITRQVGGDESKWEVLNSRLFERRQAVEELENGGEKLEAAMSESKAQLQQALTAREAMQVELKQGKAGTSDEEMLYAEERRLEKRQDALNRMEGGISGEKVRLETELERYKQEENKLTAQLRQLQEKPKREIMAGREREIKDLDDKKTRSARRIEDLRQELAGLDERINAVGTAGEVAREASKEMDTKLARIDSAIDTLFEAQAREKKRQTLPAEMPQPLAALLQGMDNIKVRPGWERALDLVAGRFLNAYKTDDMPKVLDTFKTHQNLPFVVVGKEPLLDSVNRGNQQSVADLIDGGAVPTPLSYIYICENLEQAMMRREHLKEHESVLTPRGDWLGKNWALLAGGWKAGKNTGGFLTEQKRLQDLKTTRAQMLEQYQKQQKEAEALYKEHQRLQRQLRDTRIELDRENQLLTEFMESLSRLQKQEARREEQLRRENEDWINRQEELARGKVAHSSLMAEIKELSQQRDKLHARQNPLKEEQETIVEKLSELRRRRSAKTEKENELQQEIASLAERINFLQKNLREQEANKEKMTTDILQAKQKLTQEKKEVESIGVDTEKKRLERAELETKLNAVRADRDDIAKKIQVTQNQLGQLERDTTELERDMQETHNLGQQLNLELTDLMDRNTQLTSAVLSKKSKEARGFIVRDLRERERKMQMQLDRMGDVNQLALRDYEIEKERLEKINSEMAQIDSALKDLSAAIKRIDRESRLRFDATLSKVNNNFGRLFASLSDGGKTHLIEEKSEDEQKPAGIRIMVSPLGRRHTPISLLSGGEKSLVAIALIMAIFQLNPAPFCLMDEADAMLDDENVMRFNRMLDAMMDKTQFILITHNKLTMQASRQLIGITMSEPGISRAVSVDLEKAIEMSEELEPQSKDEEG